MVRSLAPADLPAAACLQRQHLNHGLFPALGQSFLRAYLKSFIDSSAAVALAASDEDGALAGFLVGTLDDDQHYGQVIRRDGRRLAVRAAVAMAFRPRVALRFLRTRASSYGRGIIRLARRTGTTAGCSSDGVAVLTHVVVAEPARSRGTGTMLVEAFVRHAHGSGARRAELLTRSGDAGTADFYDRMGWALMGTVQDREGLRWDRYQLPLTGSGLLA